MAGGGWVHIQIDRMGRKMTNKNYVHQIFLRASKRLGPADAAQWMLLSNHGVS